LKNLFRGEKPEAAYLKKEANLEKRKVLWQLQGGENRSLKKACRLEREEEKKAGGCSPAECGENQEGGGVCRELQNKKSKRGGAGI